MEVVGEVLKQQRIERDQLGEILMNALRDNMPYGLEIDLGLERKAKFVGINGSPKPEVYQMPIYENDRGPALESPGAVIGQGEWRFTCDFQLENCDQDHIEITTQITGGGGFV